MNPPSESARAKGRWPVILLVIGLGGCTTTRSPEPPPTTHLRVLTYNVNWGAPGADLALEIIRRSQADIVCLQETTAHWERLLGPELKHDYPFAGFRESRYRTGGGLAFFSRIPAREIAYIPSDTGWFDGWLLQFETAIGPVQVLNVHLRPPVSDRGNWMSGYFSTREDRVREMERFYARRRPGVPMLVAGDFNDSDDSPVLRWLEEAGLLNALPQFDRKSPTWIWRTGLMTLKRRMDHIVYSSELHCTSARVIREGASDHFPIEAVFVPAR